MVRDDANLGRRTRRGARGERGSSLLLALGSALPLMIAGGTLLFTVVRERAAAEQASAEVLADDVAASGAHDALARLAANPAYAGSYTLAVAGHTAEVTVTAWAGDGLDNDGNGLVDDAAEADFSTIDSEGLVNVVLDAQGNAVEAPTRSARGRVTAIAWMENLTVPATTAFYCHDPEADWDFQGTTFLISGHDLNPDGTKGGAPSVPGIGTPGNTISITKQLKTTQKPRVKGVGTWPSVKTVGGIDIDSLFADWAPYATTTYDGPSDVLGDVQLGDRTNLMPEVVLAKGDLKLTGNATGCGILLVEGNLEITGDLDYAGLIVVGGNTTFRPDPGRKQRLWGAFVTTGVFAGEDIEIGGDCAIQYSANILGTVGQGLSGLRLIAWTPH